MRTVQMKLVVQAIAVLLLIVSASENHVEAAKKGRSKKIIAFMNLLSGRYSGKGMGHLIAKPVRVLGNSQANMFILEKYHGTSVSTLKIGLVSETDDGQITLKTRNISFSPYKRPGRYAMARYEHMPLRAMKFSNTSCYGVFSQKDSTSFEGTITKCMELFGPYEQISMTCKSIVLQKERNEDEDETEVAPSAAKNETDVDSSDTENETEVDPSDAENKTDVDPSDDLNERDAPYYEDENETEVDPSDAKDERDVDLSDDLNERDAPCQVDETDVDSADAENKTEGGSTNAPNEKAENEVILRRHFRYILPKRWLDGQENNARTCRYYF